jgi:hypothetical protein
MLRGSKGQLEAVNWRTDNIMAKRKGQSKKTNHCRQHTTQKTKDWAPRTPLQFNGTRVTLVKNPMRSHVYRKHCPLICRLSLWLIRLYSRTVVLSVLRFTDSNYPFDIFKLFLWTYLHFKHTNYICNLPAGTTLHLLIVNIRFM